jgi:serine/threonine-protein kinase RsbT
MSVMRMLEETLAQHMSPINARVVAERSRRVLHDPTLLTADVRSRFLLTLRANLRLFTSDERAATIVEELERRLIPNVIAQNHEHKSFSIEDEDDLRMARAEARDLCLAIGAGSSVAQRVATAVSELARTIVSYTPGGTIDIDATRGPPVRIQLLAQDKGSGIPNLEQVLAGQYRSKTGLGRGLIGVKRLMKNFRVQTGTSGTRIEGEIVPI